MVVMLSGAKHLACKIGILRYAQNDINDLNDTNDMSEMNEINDIGGNISILSKGEGVYPHKANDAHSCD